MSCMCGCVPVSLSDLRTSRGIPEIPTILGRKPNSDRTFCRSAWRSRLQEIATASLRTGRPKIKEKSRDFTGFVFA